MSSNYAHFKTKSALSNEPVLKLLPLRYVPNTIFLFLNFFSEHHFTIGFMSLYLKLPRKHKSHFKNISMPKSLCFRAMISVFSVCSILCISAFSAYFALSAVWFFFLLKFREYRDVRCFVLRLTFQPLCK